MIEISIMILGICICYLLEIKRIKNIIRYNMQLIVILNNLKHKIEDDYLILDRKKDRKEIKEIIECYKNIKKYHNYGIYRPDYEIKLIVSLEELMTTIKIRSI